jgi:type II secretory pathway component PulC
MKKLILVFFAVSLQAGETNVYESIVKRNAFDLTAELPKPILPPVAQILKPNVYLTGLTHFKGVRKVHLVLRPIGGPDKFISLATDEKQYNIELRKINKNSALISNNGSEELVSFENNGLPTIVTKAPVKKVLMQRTSKDKKENSKKEEKKPAPPKAHIVQVPSRKPKVDPRIIEKGLEYLSRMEDGEKRDYLLKRVESLQSGQHQIKSNIDQNERRRQYDEWRKRREDR